MPVTTAHKDAATRTVDVGGTRFAYRDLGPRTGTPVIFLNHLAGVLDNWDPRVVDGIAAQRRVITFDNRGVGASEGRTPSSIAEMATDAIAFIRGGQQPTDLSRIRHEVLVANGDQDRMVPTRNSADLARRLPNAQLVIYPDAGHGGIFQPHAQFVPDALDFLAA